MREGSPNSSSTTNREVPRAAQLSPYPGHSSGKSLRLKILAIFSHVRSSQVRGDRDFSFSEVKKKIERIIQDEKAKAPATATGAALRSALAGCFVEHDAACDAGIQRFHLLGVGDCD